MKKLLALLVLLVLAPAALAQQYTPDWKSLDARPTPPWFNDAKFGIFIHWGVYAVPSWSVPGEYAEWYWRRIISTNDGEKPWRDFHAKMYGANFNYMDFAPQFKAELFDPDQWARVFKDAGAQYVVLTSKHHDGFALWPSKEANKAWGRPWNSVDIGPKRDLLGDLATSVRKAGLKMGFYYSLYEWFNPIWLKDRKKFVTEHMHPQFKDVVTRYAPSIIFSDGEWDMPSSDWKAEELLAWLYNESPCKDEVIVNDRWGKESRHKHGGYFTTEYGAGMPDATHPWEENRGMAHSYGFSRTEELHHYRTGQEFVWMFADLVSRGGNLLLNIGPTHDGRIPVIMQDRLLDMGAWLKVNGEAIYGTRTWKQTAQWSDGELPKQGFGQYKEKYDITKSVGATAGPDGKARKQAFFTTKGGALYAIMPAWPGKTFTLKNVKTTGAPTVQFLGLPGTLTSRVEGNNLIIDIPQLGPDQLPCKYAWTLKITGISRD